MKKRIFLIPIFALLLCSACTTIEETVVTFVPPVNRQLAQQIVGTWITTDVAGVALSEDEIAVNEWLHDGSGSVAYVDEFGDWFSQKMQYLVTGDRVTCMRHDGSVDYWGQTSYRR